MAGLSLALGSFRLSTRWIQSPLVKETGFMRRQVFGIFPLEKKPFHLQEPSRIDYKAVNLARLKKFLEIPENELRNILLKEWLARNASKSADEVERLSFSLGPDVTDFLTFNRHRSLYSEDVKYWDSFLLFECVKALKVESIPLSIYEGVVALEERFKKLDCDSYEKIYDFWRQLAILLLEIGVEKEKIDKFEPIPFSPIKQKMTEPSPHDMKKLGDELFKERKLKECVEIYKGIICAGAPNILIDDVVEIYNNLSKACRGLQEYPSAEKYASNAEYFSSKVAKVKQFMAKQNLGTFFRRKNILIRKENFWRRTTKHQFNEISWENQRKLQDLLEVPQKILREIIICEWNSRNSTKYEDTMENNFRLACEIPFDVSEELVFHRHNCLYSDGIEDWDLFLLLECAKGMKIDAPLKVFEGIVAVEEKMNKCDAKNRSYEGQFGYWRRLAVLLLEIGVEKEVLDKSEPVPIRPLEQTKQPEPKDWKELADLAFEKQEFKESIKMYKKVICAGAPGIAIDGVVSIYTNLSQAYREVGDRPSAEKYASYADYFSSKSIKMKELILKENDGSMD